MEEKRVGRTPFATGKPGSDSIIGKLTKKMSPIQIIVMGFLGIILIGTGLLMLPISAQSGVVTPFSEALLTATSATCVTGLIVHDTATYWTLFGQIVILLLIQIGGLGFMTILISVISLTGKKIGLHQRVTMRDAIGGQQVGGMVGMGRFIMVAVLLVEVLGALLLLPVFIPQFGIGKGIYYSLFHAISAFCNAGFDLMGTVSPYSSLTSFADNWYLNLVVMTLIVLGGLGFFVWVDVLANRGRIQKFSLHSKLVLCASGILLVGGALFFFLFEGQNPHMGDNIFEKTLSAVFHSVSVRTAGFNTVDLTTLSEPSQLVTCIFMLIGGSPGSTAGGLKTTTVVILVLGVLAELRARKSVECFGRRLDENLVRQACCIVFAYFTTAIVAAIAIVAIEGGTMLPALFETTSAVGTVGLSLGLTPNLSLPSQLIITFLMFVGRVGGFSFLLFFGRRINFRNSQLPLEKVAVG